MVASILKWYHKATKLKPHYLIQFLDFLVLILS